MWMALGMLAVTGFFLLFILIDPKKIEDNFSKALFFAYIARIAWVVTLSILFYRINSAWKVSQANLEMLNE